MDPVPESNILEYPPDALQCILKLYGLDNADVLNDSISSLQDWVNKQDHFVRKDFGREYLQWTLVTSKGSIERAKERLDKYCTGKVLHKKMFEKLDLNADFNNLNEYYLAMLPKFSNSFYRVAMFKILKVPKDTNGIHNMHRHAIVFLESLRGHCYLNGIISVLDYSDVNIVEISKILNIADIRNYVSVIADCFGMRLKGIHVITTSNLFEVLVSLLKQGLSEKLGQRIKVHKTYETLSDFIPKQILPVEYGGTEKSLVELNESWRKALSSKENIEHLRKMQEFRTEESLRRLDDFNNQYMGAPGSFRRFVVD